MERNCTIPGEMDEQLVVIHIEMIFHMHTFCLLRGLMYMENKKDPEQNLEKY